ncbi:MAG TPA: hypothetical protein VHN99_07140 [Deinococcales bacterium]|nr:hypothetical protein [Deinococcales bacterium]
MTLCLTLTNGSSSPVDVVLPGDLLFKAAIVDHPYQNGIVGQPISITVPTGTHVYVIDLYCTDAHLNPSDPDSRYGFGPIVSNPDLTRVVDILKSKQPVRPGQYAATVQFAIWDITNNGGLTSADLSDLNALP